MRVGWESILMVVDSVIFEGLVVVRFGEFGACAEMWDAGRSWAL